MTAPFSSFPGGVHPEQNKDRSTSRSITAVPVPRRLVLPLSQHIGTPSTPTVSIGQHVRKGERIAHAEGYVSVALHAPTSGVIVDIGDYPIAHPSGLSARCIVIDSDGEDRWTERVVEADYTRVDPSHLRNLIRDAGIVGMGGAGFPTFIKLNPGPRKHIDTLIINGIECEPFITCDDLLMRERAGDIVAGIHIMRHALQAKNVLIAIEDNKPQAYAAMQRASAGTDFRTILCPTVYPQGGEKQLIQVLTGKEVPTNGLPLQIGIVVQNVATAAAVHYALRLGHPLVSRVVTVTGEGVAKPGNYEVLIGTPMRDVLAAAEVAPDIERLIMGGPMMGFGVHDHAAPVLKTTNCLLAQRPLARKAASVLPCIRCGACMEACPVSLLPQQLYWATQAKDFDQAQELNLFDCIECGCCAYVCPSNIPLVHHYRYAKGEIWKQEREKEKADVARKRYEFRLERLDRDKAQRADRHAKKKEELATPEGAADTDKDAKQAAILAAMERVRQKKAQQSVTPKNVENLTESQRQMIADVEQRRGHGQDPQRAANEDRDNPNSARGGSEPSADR